MSTNTEPPIKGTISHGTLRSEDLLGAFLGALDILDVEAARALAHEVGETYQGLLDGAEGAEEDAGWLLERMSDRINAALPEGWIFGAHEGDGSDFGVWWGYDEEPDDGSSWAILDADGSVMDRFETEEEAREAELTGEYGDDAEVAYINDPFTGDE